MIISVVIVIVSISDFGSNPWALYQPSSLYNALKGVLRRKPSALLTLVPSKTLYKCCRAQMCQNLSDSLSLPFIWGLFGFSPRYQAFFPPQATSVTRNCWDVLHATSKPAKLFATRLGLTRQSWMCWINHVLAPMHTYTIIYPLVMSK